MMLCAQTMARKGKNGDNQKKKTRGGDILINVGHPKHYSVYAKYEDWDEP